MMKAVFQKDQWSQNTEQAPGPREEFTFECFMRPQRERVAGSPRTPCPNVTLTKPKSPVPRPLRGRLLDQLLKHHPANGFLLVIVFLERRIVFRRPYRRPPKSPLVMHAL
jgi:hypothetical protein